MRTLRSYLAPKRQKTSRLSAFVNIFFYNRTYDDLNSDLPLRILVGHKGIGKSALLRRASINDTDRQILGVWLTPGDIAGLTGTQTLTKDFNQLVEYWKRGLLAIIANHILGESAKEIFSNDKIANFAARITSFVPALSKVLSEKSGNVAPEIHAAIIETFSKTGVINVLNRPGFTGGSNS